MARNPNPTRIAEPTWRVWEETSAATPGVRFGGIYAPKPYYHSSVEENLAKWAPNYSIRLWLDLNRGNRKFARAIDWTMSTTEMKKRTGYLRRSALDRRDNRLRAMREFYGTLDGKTVFGLSKDDEDGPWNSATSDSSHLWHIHGAIFAAFVNDWAALEGIASAWSGETWEAWAKRKWGGSAPTLPVSGIPEPVLREGAEGPAVLALQVYLNGVIAAGLVEDGDFGPATTAAVRELQHRAGITINGTYDTASADALRNLVEDDMDLTDPLPVTEYTKTTWNRLTLDVRTALSHGYVYSRSASDRTAKLLQLQEAVLAKLAGADTKTILDAINARAAEDAQRDTAAGQRDAEILALIAQVGSGRLAADEVVARIGELLTGPGE
jgi:peptidoglycan hydrolase-like protein with peptidoglycan-binding domain